MQPSGAGYEPEWWKSLLFLENYKMMATGEHPNVSPLGVMWSLCIEEHFYIIWGLLLWAFKRKAMPAIIIISIITGIASRMLYAVLEIPSLDLFTNIDLFAYGAIPAYLLIKNAIMLQERIKAISITYKRLFAMAVIAIVIICSQYTKDAYTFTWMAALLGLLFAGLILFTLPKATRFSISDKNIISRLGVFTYGLYMYHTLVINLLLQLFPKTGLALDEPPGAVVFIILSLLLSILCSIASYHLFEKQFLKLKKLFRKQA